MTMSMSFITVDSHDDSCEKVNMKLFCNTDIKKSTSSIDKVITTAYTQITNQQTYQIEHAYINSIPASPEAHDDDLYCRHFFFFFLMMLWQEGRKRKSFIYLGTEEEGKKEKKISINFPSNTHKKSAYINPYLCTLSTFSCIRTSISNTPLTHTYVIQCYCLIFLSLLFFFFTIIQMCLFISTQNLYMT